MWRGLLAAGVFFAFLGGIVVLVVMGSAAGCSGGYNCTPSTVAMSIGVLLTGLGFLLAVVAFGMRPGLAVSGSQVEHPPPFVSPGQALPSPFRALRSNRLALVALLLFFLGLLISAAGYLEFFSGDWFNESYATWNYPNGWAGVAVMTVGVLMWFSALILNTLIAWRKPRPASPSAPTFLYPTSYPVTMTGPGLWTPPPPPPPPSNLPPPPPPIPYPPGTV